MLYFELYNSIQFNDEGAPCPRTLVPRLVQCSTNTCEHIHKQLKIKENKYAKSDVNIKRYHARINNNASVKSCMQHIKDHRQSFIFSTCKG